MKNIKSSKKPVSGKKAGAPPANPDGRNAGGGNAAGNEQALHDIYQPLTAINNYAQAGILVIENGGQDVDQLNGIFKKIWLQSLRAIEISKNMTG